MIDTLAERINTKSNNGIRTQFDGINKLLNGGFEPGMLCIIAAKTGQGKSAFSLNLLQEIAVNQKIPCLYLNTEMSEQQIHIRLMTMLGRVSHYRTATGTLTPDEKARVFKGIDAVPESGLLS